jgi:hypothetical protein
MWETQCGQAQMNVPQSQPISRYLSDAFYGAVQLFPYWTALDHGPLVFVGGRRYTISEVCNLVINATMSCLPTLWEV